MMEDFQIEDDYLDDPFGDEPENVPIAEPIQKALDLGSACDDDDLNFGDLGAVDDYGID